MCIHGIQGNTVQTRFTAPHSRGTTLDMDNTQHLSGWKRHDPLILGGGNLPPLITSCHIFWGIILAVRWFFTTLYKKCKAAYSYKHLHFSLFKTVHVTSDNEYEFMLKTTDKKQQLQVPQGKDKNERKTVLEMSRKKLTQINIWSWETERRLFFFFNKKKKSCINII